MAAAVNAQQLSNDQNQPPALPLEHDQQADCCSPVAAVVDSNRSTDSCNRRVHAPLARRLGGSYRQESSSVHEITPPMAGATTIAEIIDEKKSADPVLFVNRRASQPPQLHQSAFHNKLSQPKMHDRYHFSPPLTATSNSAASYNNMPVMMLKAYESLSDESNTFSKLLHRRSLARTLSAMYALIMVTVSFCFVISMLWIDQFTRMSTDIISTLLLLPGILFIIVSFLTMYEPHDINKLSSSSTRASNEQTAKRSVFRRVQHFLSSYVVTVWRRLRRCRRHRRVFAGSISSTSTAASSTTAPSAEGGKSSPSLPKSSAKHRPESGVHADDNEPLNVYLKAATIIFTFGSVAHHLVLLIGFHFTPLMPPPHSLSFASSSSSATADLMSSSMHSHHQHHPLQLLLPLTSASAAARAPIATGNSKRMPAVLAVDGEPLATNAKLTAATTEGASHGAHNFNPQDAFSWDEFFWHMYTLLSVLLYLLELAFTLKMSRFRFTKYPLLSCLGMVHLFAINAYLWLYLTALETQVDLGEQQYNGGLVGFSEGSAHNMPSSSTGFDATITTNFGQSLLSTAAHQAEQSQQQTQQEEALQVLLVNLLATLQETRQLQQRMQQHEFVVPVPVSAKIEQPALNASGPQKAASEKLYMLLLHHLEAEQQLRAMLNDTSPATLAKAVSVISPIAHETTFAHLPRRRRRRKRHSIDIPTSRTITMPSVAPEPIAFSSSPSSQDLEKQDIPIKPLSSLKTGGGSADEHEYLTKPLGASLKSNGNFIRSLPEYLFHFVIEMVIINMTLFFVKWFQLTRMPQPHRQLRRHNTFLSASPQQQHRPVRSPNNSWGSSNVYYTSSSNTGGGRSTMPVVQENSNLALFRSHASCNFRKCEPNLSPTSSSAYCVSTDESEQHVSNNWRTLVTVLRHESLRGTLSLVSGAAFVICTIAAVWLLKWDEDDLIFRQISLTFECVLYVVTIAAGLYAWRKLSSKLHRVKKRSVRERTEKALLGLSIIGIYSFATFLVLGSHREVTTESVLTWLSSLLMIVETSVQTILIYDAIKRAIVQIQLPELGSTTYDGHELRRHRYVQLPKNISTSCLTGNAGGTGGRLQFLMHDIAAEGGGNGKNDFRRNNKCPGRDTLGFLVLANIAFWFINVFRTVKARAHPLQMEYYGPVAWTILVHLTVPFMILFRFHSSCMLFEIWINAHKIFTLVGSDNNNPNSGGNDKSPESTNKGPQENRLTSFCADSNFSPKVNANNSACSASGENNPTFPNADKDGLAKQVSPESLVPSQTSFGYYHHSIPKTMPCGGGKKLPRYCTNGGLPSRRPRDVCRKKSALKLLPSDEGVQSAMSDEDVTGEIEGEDQSINAGLQTVEFENQGAIADLRTQSDGVRLKESRRYASL